MTSGASEVSEYKFISRDVSKCKLNNGIQKQVGSIE